MIQFLSDESLEKEIKSVQAKINVSTMGEASKKLAEEYLKFLEFEKTERKKAVLIFKNKNSTR